MSFEVFKKPGNGRADEINQMLNALSEKPEQLAAKIDASPMSVRYFAKKLNFKTTIHDNYDGTCIVRLIPAPKDIK